MERKEKLNLSMLFDFYEMTMANGYFRSGMQDRITYFDVFFRRVPDGGGFAIAAGLEQLVDYIRDLHFDEDDIAFLRSKNLFQEDFLDYLRAFRFTGDMWAVPEGTPVFPGEPLVTVRASASQAGISDISQRGDKLRFVIADFDPQAVLSVCGAAKYRQRLAVSAGEVPALTLTLGPKQPVLETALGLVEDLKLARG